MKNLRLLGTSALVPIAVAGSFIFAAPALAQAPEQPSPQGDACQAPANQVDKNKCPDVTASTAVAASSAAAENTGGEGITVVGSRIRRNQFNTADPINLITRDEATQAGFASTAEILQSTAVTGGTSQINDLYGGFVVAGGPGVNTVSLRGLGTTRTLVLLNGRRISPAGSRGSVGAADLNTLPNAMVDRIEVLNSGASSIYGSDAVAGVVNIVTRTNINGLDVEAQHDFTEHGGGFTRRYSAVFGKTLERLKFGLSLEYFKREPVSVGQRGWASCPTQYYGTNGSDFGAGDFIDPRTGKPKCFPLENGGTTFNTIGTPNLAGNPLSNAPGVPAGYTGTCNRFRPNPAVTAGPIPGYECVGGGSLSTNIRDTFAQTKLSQDLLSGAETYTGYGQVSYETGVLGNAEVWAEALVSRRKSSQLDERQFTIDYPLGSPLIPAALRFPTAFLGATGGFPATGVRVFANYGNYNNYQTVDFVRLNAGIRGDLFGPWRYDAYVGKSFSDAKYTTDLVLTDRLIQSLDVVASGSGFVCRNVAGGCVAAPALTPAVVGGQFPSAWIDYVTDPVQGNTSFRETTANISFDGPLFRLPGGDIQVAIGAEYRKSHINDVPAPDSQRGNLFGFTSSTITRGSDSVWEAFGEIELPVIRDSFIHELTINGSGRYTHYKSYGGQETYKIGGLLSPIKGLSFRGSYGTSYRAPALFEQFLGSTSGFLPNTNDPCNDLASVTNPLIRSRCISEGLPADANNSFRQNNSLTVIGVGGAAAGLKAETSKNYNAGIVIEPNFGPSFGALSIAADYFDVRIDNGVSQLTAANVLSQCYNNPERTTCDTGLITREAYTGPGTGRLTVIQSFVNISTARATGIDYTVRYANDIGPGRLRLTGQVTQFRKRYNRTFPTTPILNVIGLINNPKFSGTFDASYRWGPWNLRWATEWTQHTNSRQYGIDNGYDPNKYYLKTPDYFLHNLSVQYEKDNFQITLGVRNLLDRKPPIISADYTNLNGNAPLYSGYDVFGRRFYVNVATHF